MAQKTEECKPLVVVRIRGTVSAQREARETLDLLHLTHTNHAVLIDSRPAYKGMLQRINSYITYGEPTKETVAMMIQKRALLAGVKDLWMRSFGSTRTVPSYACAIFDGLRKTYNLITTVDWVK